MNSVRNRIAAQSKNTKSATELRKDRTYEALMVNLRILLGSEIANQVEILGFGRFFDSVTFRFDGGKKVRFVRQTTGFGGPPVKFTSAMPMCNPLDDKALLRRLSE